MYTISRCSRLRGKGWEDARGHPGIITGNVVAFFRIDITDLITRTAELGFVIVFADAWDFVDRMPLDDV